MENVVYRHNRNSGEVHTGVRRGSGEVAFTEGCNTDSMTDWVELEDLAAAEAVVAAGGSWCEHCKA